MLTRAPQQHVWKRNIHFHPCTPELQPRCTRFHREKMKIQKHQKPAGKREGNGKRYSIEIAAYLLTLTINPVFRSIMEGTMALTMYITPFTFVSITRSIVSFNTNVRSSKKVYDVSRKTSRFDPYQGVFVGLRPTKCQSFATSVRTCFDIQLITLML